MFRKYNTKYLDGDSDLLNVTEGLRGDASSDRCWADRLRRTGLLGDFEAGTFKLFRLCRVEDLTGSRFSGSLAILQ